MKWHVTAYQRKLESCWFGISVILSIFNVITLMILQENTKSNCIDTEKWHLFCINTFHDMINSGIPVKPQSVPNPGWIQNFQFIVQILGFFTSLDKFPFGSLSFPHMVIHFLIYGTIYSLMVLPPSPYIYNPYMCILCSPYVYSHALPARDEWKNISHACCSLVVHGVQIPCPGTTGTTG